MFDIYSLTFDQFSLKLRQQFGKGDYHARALYRSIFKENGKAFNHLTEVQKSGDFAERFAETLTFPSLITESVQEDVVTKFVSRLHDDTFIETVIIPMGDTRTTLCISSQVGCRMGCSFCKTGDMGFTRNLTTAEIVGQVMKARFEFGADIRNIVFMGMGEPLDNLENVIQALDVLTQQHGIDIPYSKITVSTSGVAEGIRELIRRDKTDVRLAISLNGAEDRLRKKIMPITNKFSLEDLKDSLKEFPLKRKRDLFFIEYVMLKGVNDTPEDASRIVQFCEGLPVMVNLIPYNGENYKQPSQDEIDAFRDLLSQEGLFVVVRTARGDDISAACGQLATEAQDS